MAKSRTIQSVIGAVIITFVCNLGYAILITEPSGWQPLTSEMPLSSLTGQSLIVGDKEFSDFEIFGIGAGGAIAPDPCSVYVQGGIDADTGDYGLRFLLSWNAGPGQTVNANLNFKVSIYEPVASNDQYFIKDVKMLLVGASATGTGTVNASENAYDAPVPTGAVLASLSTSKNPDDSGVHLSDYAEFRPVKSIWVYKDISITGGTGDNPQSGSAHLSEFYQFYSQVPEPATMSLLALGALGLLRRKRA